MEGSTLVTGRNARALSVEGDVGGSIRIQGTVGHQTSFAYDDDGNSVLLSRFDLRLGAPAVAIEGSVAGGIVVAAPPADNDSADTDEDDDGVTDSSEGTGTVTSYGTGPAMQIGGASGIVIGAPPAANGSFSLLVEGSVAGSAKYSRTDAYGKLSGGGLGATGIRSDERGGGQEGVDRMTLH